MRHVHLLLLLSMLLSAGQAQQLFQHPMINFLGHQSYEMGITNGSVLPYSGMGHPYLLRSQHLLFSEAIGIGIGPQPSRPNGLGRLALTDFSGYRSWVSAAGSQRGHWDLSGVSRIGRDSWGNTLGISWQGIRQNRDVNKDGFRDIPESSQLFIKESWRIMQERWSVQVGGMYYQLEERGGQMETSPPPSRPDGKRYQLTDEVEHWVTGLAAVVYLTEDQDHQLHLAANWRGHQQQSRYGKRWFQGAERRAEASLSYRYLGLQQQLTAGVQYSHQAVKQELANLVDNRRPGLAGVFLFHDWIMGNHWILKSGQNLDYHQELGWQWSPSLRLDYQPQEEWQVGAFVGRDYRVPQLLAENQHLAFSGRNWTLEAVEVEDIWYAGLGVKTANLFVGNIPISAKAVYIFQSYRQGNVVDVLSDPERVQLYALDGPAQRHQIIAGLTSHLFSYSLSLGLHYQYQDAWQTSRVGRETLPFLSRHRLWLSSRYGLYRSNDKTYLMRLNIGVQSPQYLPAQNPNHSPWLHQVQCYLERSAPFKAHGRTRYHLFIGGENLLNQRQLDPLTSANQPFAPDFDGAMAWGKPQGVRLLAGLRFSW